MKGKDFYLAEAERIRVSARSLPDRTARERLLNIAETYDQLAEMAGRRRQPPPE